MDKAQVVTLVGNLVLKKAGKILSDSEFIKAAEAGDTFNVFPVKGSAATVLPGHEIIKALKETFAKSAFTFFAKAVTKPVEEKK
ncbi:MAG: hypothetical protein ACOYOU_00880 [Kiritimatiellia bacterium]